MTTTTVHHQAGADPALIRSRPVAIVGSGSQGHAHARNVDESRVDVVVGLMSFLTTKSPPS